MKNSLQSTRYLLQRCRAAARVIMEEYLGRSLTSSELIHHKDEDPTNNSIDNLMITSRSSHGAIHNVGRHAISENGKERIRQAKHHRVISVEARKRMGHPGNKNRLGVPHTQATRTLMSESQARRWKERRQNAEETEQQLRSMPTKGSGLGSKPSSRRT